MLSLLWPEFEYNENLERSKLRVAGGGSALGNNPLGYGCLGSAIAAAVMESAQTQKRPPQINQRLEDQQQQEPQRLNSI